VLGNRQHVARIETALLILFDASFVNLDPVSTLQIADVPELEALVGALSPSIATLGDAESDEDAVDRLLREAVAAAATRDAARESTPAARLARASLRRLPADAILALARVLSGPATERYRATSGSRPGAYYVLDVDGGDVTCTCAGFEYRGACSHARALKAALATGGALPAGMEVAS
jgi:hypothetical protein